MDSRLLNDVRLSEGLSLTAYQDSLGFWTIGYGHKLNQPSQGYTITIEQANAYLASDLGYAQETCIHLPEWPFLDTDCRQNAVTELVFNMGTDGWRKFAKCRFFIQQQNWQGAHDELLNSLWCHQVGPKRSQRLASYLLNGQYP